MTPLDFEISLVAFKHGFTWEYGTTTHKILLPNFRKINKQSKEEADKLTTKLINDTPEDVNHEILHKILHEVVSYEAMDKFDRIDKGKSKSGERIYIMSCIPLVNDIPKIS